MSGGRHIKLGKIVNMEPDIRAHELDLSGHARASWCFVVVCRWVESSGSSAFSLLKWPSIGGMPWERPHFQTHASVIFPLSIPSIPFNSNFIQFLLVKPSFVDALDDALCPALCQVFHECFDRENSMDSTRWGCDLLRGGLEQMVALFLGGDLHLPSPLAWGLGWWISEW